MILEGCNAIVVNAANPESLNSVVEEACAQGIPVVSFDGTVTADCAYRIGVDFVDMGYQELVFLADKLPEGGKLLENRGVSPGRRSTSRSARASTRASPSSRSSRSSARSTVNWAQDVAQQAVAEASCRRLPEDIVGVVTQGGDGYGAAQAFADAGRPRPLIIMGNRQDELAWWKEQKDARRLRDDVALDRSRLGHRRLLGRAAAARRGPGRSRMTSSCRTCAGTRTTSRPRSRRWSPVTSAPRSTPSKRCRRPSKRTSRSDRSVSSGLTGSDDPTSGRVAITSPSRSLCGPAPPIVRARRSTTHPHDRSTSPR